MKGTKKCKINLQNGNKTKESELEIRIFVKGTHLLSFFAFNRRIFSSISWIFVNFLAIVKL